MVVLCFGVLGTGLAPALAASADSEAAEALTRDWQGSLRALLKIRANPHRKCKSEVRCFTGDIPREEISQHLQVMFGERGNYRQLQVH